MRTETHEMVLFQNKEQDINLLTSLHIKTFLSKLTFTNNSTLEKDKFTTHHTFEKKDILSSNTPKTAKILSFIYLTDIYCQKCQLKLMFVMNITPLELCYATKSNI